jgi:hypothetical protein
MLGSPTVERQSVTALDLRRGVRREEAEVLVRRAAALPEPDRRLVEAVFRDQLTVSQLASIWRERKGRQADARFLRRRLRRLVERMRSSDFETVLACRARWSPTRRRVATACVLHGLSIRQAAEELGLSLHAVRRHLHAVTAVCETVSRGSES